jgi:hypothetical protein
MDVIIPIIVQLIGGGVGGNVIAQIIKRLDLGPTGNTIAGAVGGLILTWIAGKVPGLDSLVGAVASSTGGAGGISPGALAGQGISGLIGGAVLTAIVGAIKNATMK